MERLPLVRVTDEGFVRLVPYVETLDKIDSYILCVSFSHALEWSVGKCLRMVFLRCYSYFIIVPRIPHVDYS